MHVVQDHNKLTGSIPASLGSLQHLLVLQLSDNALTGSGPAKLGQLSRLAMASTANRTPPSPPASGVRACFLRHPENLARGRQPWSNSNCFSHPELAHACCDGQVHLEDNQLEGFEPGFCGRTTAIRVFECHGNRFCGGVGFNATASAEAAPAPPAAGTDETGLGCVPAKCGGGAAEAACAARAGGASGAGAAERGEAGGEGVDGEIRRRSRQALLRRAAMV